MKQKLAMIAFGGNALLRSEPGSPALEWSPALQADSYCMSHQGSPSLSILN